MYGKIKNVPNHQPVYGVMVCYGILIWGSDNPWFINLRPEQISTWSTSIHGITGNCTIQYHHTVESICSCYGFVQNRLETSKVSSPTVPINNGKMTLIGIHQSLDSHSQHSYSQFSSKKLWNISNVCCENSLFSTGPLSSSQTLTHYQSLLNPIKSHDFPMIFLWFSN